MISIGYSSEGGCVYMSDPNLSEAIRKKCLKDLNSKRKRRISGIVLLLTLLIKLFNKIKNSFIVNIINKTYLILFTQPLRSGRI